MGLVVVALLVLLPNSLIGSGPIPALPQGLCDVLPLWPGCPRASLPVAHHGLVYIGVKASTIE